MNNELVSKVLSAILKSKGQAEITVMGISMNPTLLEGDKVIIKKSSEYRIGDIIVFNYKNEGILIHRLLKYDGRYFCKGDNALRLEDIEYNQIIGKAVLVNNTTIQPWDDWKVRLSYSLNREFVKLRYNMDKIKKSNIYRIYSVLILRKEENKMNYQKTDKMDFILSDETSLAVFDPESGNTYFFDETGIDILNCLDVPCDIQTLLEKLCNIYSVTPEDIRSDVEEFLADTVTKGIVEII